MAKDDFPSNGFLIADARGCNSEDVIDSGLRVWYPNCKNFETKGHALVRLFVATHGVTASLCGQKVECVELSRKDENGNPVPIRIGLSNLQGDSDFVIAVILPAQFPKVIFHTIVEEVACLISMHTFCLANPTTPDEANHLRGSQVGNYIVAESLTANAEEYMENFIAHEGSLSMSRALKGNTPKIAYPEKVQNAIKEACSLIQRASKHEDFVIFHKASAVDFKMDTEIAEELEFAAWVFCRANGFFADLKGSKEFQKPIALHTADQKGGKARQSFARVFGAHHRNTAVVCFEHTGNAYPPMEDPKRFVSRLKATAVRVDTLMKKGVDETNTSLCENLQKLMCISPTGEGLQGRASEQSSAATKDGFTQVPIEEPDNTAEKENSSILKRLKAPHSPTKRRSGKYQVSHRKVAKESDGVFEWSGLAEMAASHQGEANAEWLDIPFELNHWSPINKPANLACFGAPQGKMTQMIGSFAGEGVALSYRSREALLNAQVLLKRATESRQSESDCSSGCLPGTPRDALGGHKSKAQLESSRLGAADPTPYCNHRDLDAIKNFSEVEIHISTEEGGHWIKGCKLQQH